LWRELRNRVSEFEIPIKLQIPIRNYGYSKLHLLFYIIFSSESTISTLEETKKSKEAEIEKYKKYLNKAKKIIESFGGNKTSPDDSVEVQSLRTTLKEREKAYDKLEVKSSSLYVWGYVKWQFWFFCVERIYAGQNGVGEGREASSVSVVWNGKCKAYLYICTLHCTCIR